MDGGRRELLLKTFNRLNVVERLDFLSYLTTLGATALAQGWADDTYYEILSFVSRLKNDETQSLLINFAAGITENNLRIEVSSPSQGVIIRPGDRTVGR